MNLLESLANNPDLVSQLARNLGAAPADTRAGMEQLIPALARGLQRNAGAPNGIDSLLGALKSGGHQRYVEEPEQLGQPDAITDGNAILGHIFGSKDVSRNVAGRAAQETGLAPTLMKQLLPMLAAAAMGSLGQQATSGGSLSSISGSGGSTREKGAGDLLGQFLDSDGDGSVIDDVLGMAAKFF